MDQRLEHFEAFVERIGFDYQSIVPLHATHSLRKRLEMFQSLVHTRSFAREMGTEEVQFIFFIR